MKQLLTTIAVIITIFISACKKDRKALPGVTTTPLTNITSTSVSTGGIITNDGHSAINKRGIAWATHSAPTIGDSITNDGTGSGSFTSNLSGLSANTTYYLRAYAINESGTAYGNELSFKTPAGLATVSTTAVSGIVALSATGGGNITNDGGTPVTERGLVYGTTANPTISNFKIAAGAGTGTFTDTLSPLASQTTYYVRAYATNSNGTAYGNQVQFNSASANTVTDIDGNVYPYVTVCGKDWFAANLKTSKYRNGDPITDGSNTNFNWFGYTSGAFTYPNGVKSNEAQYGKMYNLEAMTDSRGICPTGWHIPSETDWESAEVCEGMDPSVAATSGQRCCGGLKFLEGGSSGLEIQKVGQLFVDQVTHATQWVGFGIFGLYFSSTVNQNFGPGWYRWRNFNSPNVSPSNPDIIERGTADRSYIEPVRCVRD